MPTEMIRRIHRKRRSDLCKNASSMSKARITTTRHSYFDEHKRLVELKKTGGTITDQNCREVSHLVDRSMKPPAAKSCCRETDQGTRQNSCVDAHRSHQQRRVVCQWQRQQRSGAVLSVAEVCERGSRRQLRPRKEQMLTCNGVHSLVRGFHRSTISTGR